MKFIAEHFREIFLFGVVWNVVWFAWVLWKRSRKGLKLPKPQDAGVLFVERFASGCSHKSLLTRMGGARNCLTVIVTGSDLAITTFFPFTAFAGTYDLEHLIPRKKILKIEERGKIVDIEFFHQAGSTAKVSLRLRKAGEFLRAIRSSPDQPREMPPPLPRLGDSGDSAFPAK